MTYSLAKVLIRHRFLQSVLNHMLWFNQTIGINTIINRLVPISRRLPKLTYTPLWKLNYLASNRSANNKVSLFLGCASNTLDADTLKASIFVLNALNIDVEIPPTQGCCGSIARQMGDAAEAKNLIKHNAIAFTSNQPIITIASGCGAGLHDYHPQHKIIDISTYLLSCDWSKVKIAPLKQKILVQDPCSLRNVQGAQQAVYHLLNRIPQADIVGLAGNAQCCGGAGAYMLTQPDMANALRLDKLHAIQNEIINDTEVILCTSNIGCSLHIAAGLREQKMNVRVLHPIQIIAAQMGYIGQI